MSPGFSIRAGSPCIPAGRPYRRAGSLQKRAAGMKKMPYNAAQHIPRRPQKKKTQKKGKNIFAMKQKKCTFATDYHYTLFVTSKLVQQNNN